MFPTFELFGKTIGTYMVTALLGVFAAGIFSCRAAKKRGYDENDMIVLLLVSCIGVLLGSHILFALTNWNALLVFFTHLPEIIAAGELVDSFLAVFGGSVFYGGCWAVWQRAFFTRAAVKKSWTLLPIPTWSPLRCHCFTCSAASVASWGAAVTEWKATLGLFSSTAW